MRFSRIVIRNYRQYRSIDLDFPSDPNHDLHVLVATNGVGKSNLLNAINWCLYGDEPHLNDDSTAMPICNVAAIEDAKESGIPSIEIKVSIIADADNKTIVFSRVREWNIAGNYGSRPTLTVRTTYPNGNSDFVEGDEAVSIVDEYFPQRIREYFFFDGERLSSYFSKNGRTKQVRASIEEIAQVNILSKARKHLDDIASQYGWKCRSKSSEISEQREIIERLEGDLEAAKAEYQKAVEQVETADEEIARINAIIEGCEPAVDANKRFRANQEQLTTLDERRGKALDNLEAFIRDYTVILNLYEALSRTNDYITKQYDAGHLPPDIDPKFLRQSIENHVCALCEGQIGQSAIAHIQELLDKIEVSSQASNCISQIKNDVASIVAQAADFPKDRDEAIQELRSIDEEIKRLTEENSILESTIAKVQDVDYLEDLINDRRNYEAIKDTNNVKKGSTSIRKANLEAELAEANSAMEKLLAQAAVSDENAAYAERTRQLCNIVTEIEEEITSEVRRRMEECTFERFSELLNKSNTYKSVTLDEDYNLELWHVRGYSCLGSTSAAEHELLALAFTLALHSVSGNESLLFIDTPVGRVSDENRRHFAEVLREVSKSKQLILAFTPSELSSEVREVFIDTGVAKQTVLKIDDSEETTRRSDNG